MLITLKNEFLTVILNSLGAELTSMLDTEGRQLVWQGDPAVWGRHAPLLFPIIGRLRNQRYTLDGREIAIPQHGFARDLEFSVYQPDSSHVTFTLTDNEETREVYPFSFTLKVIYTLEGCSLKKAHRVTNRSDREMPYELGGHDGYCTTLLPGETMEDYYLEFPQVEVLEPFHMDENCFLTPEKHQYPLTDHRLALPPRVFGLDTVILEGLPVHQVTLANSKNPVRLTLEFADFAYLGIWTKEQEKDTNYICLEPWTTLPEATFVGSGLEDKQGIRILPAGQTEELSYTVTIEE